MNKKTILAGAALLTGSFLAAQANAFTFTTCGGTPVVWDDSFHLVQNTFSIAPGGQREASLDKAIARWQGVIGMSDMAFKSAQINPFPFIVKNDGQSDVIVVTRAKLAGLNGLTLMFGNPCIAGGGMEWKEADILVASDLDFGPVEQTSLATNSGRATFLHELGHAHGLDHEQFFNLMRVPQPRPLVGGLGETLDVLPDDAQGGRFLYPTGNPEVNVFASAHRRNTATDTILVNASGSVTACSGGGGKITMFAAGGNNGTVNVTQTERWWVSTSKQAFNGGLQIGQLSNTTYSANKNKFQQVTLTLPALVPGTYFIYHALDVFNQVSESREDDNVAREALTIKVINC